MKPSGYFTVLCIFGALANCAKADIVAAQELPNGRVIVNDSTAYIGSEQNHVKTPWMIVSPDAMQGFANDFTTNAISVVSEDGTNFYAHIETKDSNGMIDRTKVIHFTVDENGIPSKTGELISTENSTEYTGNNQLHLSRMRNRKLVGVRNKYLYFVPTESGQNPAYFVYNLKTHESKSEPVSGYRASYQNSSDIYTIRYQNSRLRLVQLPEGTSWQGYQPSILDLTDTQEDTNMALTLVNDEFYIAAGQGNIRKGKEKDRLTAQPVEATLPGPVSGLSNNGDEVFATTEATNAFYNVTLGQYNVVKDENGNPTPMVPPTQEGLVRVIDNRKKGGKFLYVTATGIYSVD